MDAANTTKGIHDRLKISMENQNQQEQLLVSTGDSSDMKDVPLSPAEGEPVAPSSYQSCAVVPSPPVSGADQDALFKDNSEGCCGCIGFLKRIVRKR